MSAIYVGSSHRLKGLWVGAVALETFEVVCSRTEVARRAGGVSLVSTYEPPAGTPEKLPPHTHGV